MPSKPKKRKPSKKSKTAKPQKEESLNSTEQDHSSYYLDAKARVRSTGEKPPHPPSGYCIFTARRRPILRELKPKATKIMLKNIMNREWAKID